MGPGLGRNKIKVEIKFHKINTAPTNSVVQFIFTKEGGRDNVLQCNRCMPSCY